MIKVVFFDWGYTFTLGFKDRNRKINKILKPHGLNWQKFLPCWRQFYILRSLGKIKTDKELEIVIQRALQKEIPVRKIIEIIINTHIIPREHIGVVKKLKRNYKVGIISNNVKEWVDQVLTNYKIKNLFDDVLISSEIETRKPNALIYFEALRRLSAKPEESVFISDEIADDLVGAAGLGMRTIWLKTKKKGWWREDDRKVLKIYTPSATIKNLKAVISVIKQLNNK